MGREIYPPTLWVRFVWLYAANRPLGRGARAILKIARIDEEVFDEGVISYMRDEKQWHWNENVEPARRDFECELKRLKSLPWTEVTLSSKHQISASKIGITSSVECLEWGKYLDLDPQILFDAFLAENQ